MRVLLFTLLLALGACKPAHAQTTAFQYVWDAVDQVVQPTDPSLFLRLDYQGIAAREAFDRRVDSRIEFDAHIFLASYSDGTPIELTAHIEYSLDEATTRASRWAFRAGQIPVGLRHHVARFILLKGNFPVGGLLGEITVHTGQTDRLSQAFMEELLMHEATHAGLQQRNGSIGWRLAQQADGAFISDYARDFPSREDLAETMPAWIGLRYRPDRLTQADRSRIEDVIPNRLEYLDGLGLDAYPLIPSITSQSRQHQTFESVLTVSQSFPNPTFADVSVIVDVASGGHIDVRVTDVLGRTVEVLQHGAVHPGRHQFSWAGRTGGWSAGIYFIRVGTSARAITRIVSLQ